MMNDRLDNSGPPPGRPWMVEAQDVHVECLPSGQWIWNLLARYDDGQIHQEIACFEDEPEATE